MATRYDDRRRTVGDVREIDWTCALTWFFLLVVNLFLWGLLIKASQQIVL